MIDANRFAQATIDALQCHICVLDASGTIVAVNQAWRDFAAANLPLPRNASEGANYLAVCDAASGPDAKEAALFAAGIRAVLAGQCDAFALEYPCHSPQVKRWFLGRVTRLAKDPPHWVVVTHDNITQLKESELALRQAKDEWVCTFDAIPDLITIIDQAYRIRQINRAMADRLGQPPEELLGRTCYSVFHGLRSPPASCPHAQSLSDCMVHCAEVREERLQSDFQVTVSPLLDFQGNRTGSVHVARDITDRKRAERALEGSEAKFRGITQRSFDAIFLSDLEGRAVYVSPATERLIGATGEHLIGRHFQEFVVEPDWPRIAAAFGRIVRGGTPETVEAQVRRADGTLCFVEATGAPILVDGRPAGVQVIARDVTQRKESEAKLRRMEAQLMHTARLSAMGEMAAGIAHEVAQPLFSILNYAKAVQNLLQADGPPPVAMVAEWNGEILSAAARAGEIIARLRGFVRRADGHREPVRIGSLIEESLALVAHDLGQRQIDASLDLTAGETLVVVDRVQIQQVLVNLLRNACDALESAAAAPRRVAVSARADRAFVEIAVIDNGPGLATCDRERLFEPFYTTKPHGLGIGLAISQTIVEAHGGRLRAVESPDPGAAFCFTLPIAATT